MIFILIQLGEMAAHIQLTVQLTDRIDSV